MIFTAPELQRVADVSGTIALFAEQFAVVPLFIPEHDQVHGPDPATTEAAPDEQRLDPLGTEERLAPLALPQTPFTGVVVMFAEQFAVVPLFIPEHDQVHGPDPATTEAAPDEQRLDPLGTEERLAPLALPQTPFTGSLLIEHPVPVPPDMPLQFHL
jgi:hypothetical protein